MCLSPRPHAPMFINIFLSSPLKTNFLSKLTLQAAKVTNYFYYKVRRTNIENCAFLNLKWDKLKTIFSMSTDHTNLHKGSSDFDRPNQPNSNQNEVRPLTLLSLGTMVKHCSVFHLVPLF